MKPTRRKPNYSWFRSNFNKRFPFPVKYVPKKEVADLMTILKQYDTKNRSKLIPVGLPWDKKPRWWFATRNKAVLKPKAVLSPTKKKYLIGTKTKSLVPKINIKDVKLDVDYDFRFRKRGKLPSGPPMEPIQAVEMKTRGRRTSATKTLMRALRKARNRKNSGGSRSLVPTYGRRGGIFKPNIRTVSGEITKSFFNLGQKEVGWYTSMFKQAQKYLTTKVYSNQLSTAIGKQGMFEFIFLGADQVKLYSDNLLQQLNTSTYTSKTSKFGIKSIKAKVTISNSGNSSLFVDIYDYVPRIDQLSTNTSYETLYGAINCMGNTWSLQKPTSAFSSLDNSTYGITPFMNAAFNQCYKVLQVQRVEIAAGASHIHTHEHFIHQTFNTIIPEIYVGGCYRELTSFTMIVAAGTPAHDKTTTNQVTVAPTRVDMVVDQETIYHDYVQSNIITNYDGYLPDTSGTVEQFMVNDPTDTIITNTG